MGIKAAMEEMGNQDLMKKERLLGNQDCNGGDWESRLNEERAIAWESRLKWKNLGRGESRLNEERAIA